MSGLKVLIVDDDKDFARSWGRVIESDGHQVRLAYSGEEAIVEVQRAHYDVVFLDVMLPGMNGVECFVRIREMRPNTRVIMMTGFTVDAVLEQAATSGAFAVLHKPLDEERVLTMLDEIRPGGILIADDDPDFVAGIRSILEDAGYSVAEAHDGGEAVAMLREAHFDVALLDLRMPVIDGLEAYGKLRAEGIAIPTILITAYGREDFRKIDRLRQLEITGVLEKPFEPEHLLELIRRLLAKGAG